MVFIRQDMKNVYMHMTFTISIAISWMFRPVVYREMHVFQREELECLIHACTCLLIDC